MAGRTLFVVTAMNRSAISKFLTIGLISGTVLNGCFGGKPAIIRSESQQRAETALARGIRAGQKGNSSEALSHMSEALGISASIEDLPLRITALINLSRLHRLDRDLLRSAEYIDQALALLTPDSRLYSEAAHEKALLELTKRHLPQALTWAQKSIDTEQGDQRGARLNLAARINLESGNRAAAEGLARQALQHNRSSGHAEEEANSLRIMGIAARQDKNFGVGEKLLLETLAIDKRLGRSAKISLDLEELALLSRESGNLHTALRYLERAGDVHDAAGRLQQTLDIVEKRAVIYTSLGESDKAAELRESVRKRAVQNSSATISPSSRP